MLNRTGELWGFGDNKYGQLSSDGKDDAKPVEHSPRLLIGSGVAAISAGWTHACALLHQPRGAIRVWGRNNYHQCGSSSQEQTWAPLRLAAEVTTNLEGWKVMAGSEHCLCLTSEGRVLAWGWNEHGSCGTAAGDTVPSPSLVPLDGGPVTDIFTGSAHSFALVSYD
jgi:alpha-tubulin suppressor-like RCC1 family protein